MIYRIYVDDTLVHRSDIPDEDYQLGRKVMWEERGMR